MRTSPLLFSILAATLMSAGVVSAHAADGKFYDPSNDASSTGKTIGYELNRTIGCPGRGLMDTPCKAPPKVDTAAPADVTPEPVAEPAPVAALAPEPQAAPVPAPAPHRLVLEGVNFDFDRATLRPEDSDVIDKDMATLKEWGDVKVEVAGHTDSVGSDGYNMDLSQRRANTVRDYLISKGIAADRLVAKGYGESQPIASNDSDEGRFKNRRVELNQIKE